MLHLRSELSQLEIIMNQELTQAIASEVQLFHSIQIPRSHVEVLQSRVEVLQSRVEVLQSRVGVLQTLSHRN